MGNNLTQPDEIDLVIKETDKCDVKMDTQVIDNKPLTKFTQEDLSARYVSPYRAAYIKAHSLDS